jgi:hypothetical protein
MASTADELALVALFFHGPGEASAIIEKLITSD